MLGTECLAAEYERAVTVRLNTGLEYLLLGVAQLPEVDIGWTSATALPSALQPSGAAVGIDTCPGPYATTLRVQRACSRWVELPRRPPWSSRSSCSPFHGVVSKRRRVFS